MSPTLVTYRSDTGKPPEGAEDLSIEDLFGLLANNSSNNIDRSFHLPVLLQTELFLNQRTAEERENLQDRLGNCLQRHERPVLPQDDFGIAQSIYEGSPVLVGWNHTPVPTSTVQSLTKTIPSEMKIRSLPVLLLEVPYDRQCEIDVFDQSNDDYRFEGEAFADLIKGWQEANGVVIAADMPVLNRFGFENKRSFNDRNWFIADIISQCFRSGVACILVIGHSHIVPIRDILRVMGIESKIVDGRASRKQV